MRKFLSLFAFLFASMMMFAGSYTLTFKDSGTSSDNSTKRTTVADIIAGNADSVKAVTASNVYQARSGRGIKLGTSGGTGSLTMTLNTPVKVTSLVVNAMRYKDGEATLKIQDKSDYTLTAEAADYTYTYAEATEVSEITVASTSKRNYIISLTVNYEDEEEEPQPTTQDLYLKLSSEWAGWPAKYAVYYFNDTENGWSEFMTEVEGEDNTYTATIPVGYSKVIFVRLDGAATEAKWDNKWSQTVNLTIPENKNHFTVTSGGTGSECDGVWAKYPVVPTYYVAGTMTSWADNMVEMNEGSYTFEGLAAGKYEIKVVDNNSNWLGFDKLNTTASNKNVYGEGTGNIKFVLGEEGDVTVAYDGAKITVTGATIVAPTTVFTVTVPEGTEKTYIAGNFTKWEPAEMTLKEEGVFTYTFAGDAADSASYKYLAGPDWKYVEVNADDSEADNRGYAAADEVAKWKAVPVALKYAKVTKAPINWTGHYIISFGDSKPHMAISGSDFVAAADAPAFVDGDTISLAEGYDVEVRFSETAGAYTIKLPSEKYIKIPAGSNAVNEAETAMALYMGYYAGESQEGVQIADKADLTSTGTRMIYKNNTNYRSYTNKIDNSGYKLPTLYRLVDEAFDCQDGPYAILVNGKDVEETVAGEEFDGYKQYVAYISLSKGDSIQLINTSCGAAWLPAIEEGGMSAHFKKGVNAATIDTTGCFDLYIKMKEGDDKLYIGAGICAGDTVRYYVTGIDENWDEKAIASMKDTLVLSLKAGDYRFKVLPDGSWDGAIKGYDELTQKDKAGLKADNDRNICFTLKEAGDVTIVYNDTVFTVTGKFYVRVPEYKDLYLVPGVWAQEDAKIAAWIYTKKEGHEMEDQWTAFFAPKAEGNDTLTAKIDAEADSIVFVRFNATAEAPSWEEKDDFRWNSIAGDTIDYAGLTYTITDWYAGTWKKYEPAKFYITGDSALVVNASLDKEKAWAPDAIKVTEDSYTFENLVAGDYKLKVTDGAWSSEETPRMNLGFSDLTQEDKAGLTTDNDNNICFTLKEAGNVVVTYKVEEEAVTFTVTGKFYVRVPEYKDLYLVPGVWAQEDAKIAAWIYTRKEGAEMEDQWTAFFAPKAEGNDTLTAKIDAEADSIIFVRFNATAEAPSWEEKDDFRWNSIAGDTIDYAGLTYTITDWAAGTWDVYVPAKYYIVGDSALVGSKDLAWNPAAIKVTEDSKVLDLEAGSYMMKITLKGDWEHGVLGYDALTGEKPAGITRGEGDNNDNICFTLKEAGQVTVSYIATETDTTFTVAGNFYYYQPTLVDLKLVPGVWAEADAKIAAWAWTRKEGAEMVDQWTPFFAPIAEGNDTLSVKIDAAADSILFVRFNNEASVPTWDGGEGYIWGQMSNDSIVKESMTYTITDWAAGTWDVYVPAKYYITGIDGWDQKQIKATADEYIFENLKADTVYTLKVLPEGLWEGGTILGYDELTVKPEGIFFDASRNVCFKLAEAGNVTVTYKVENEKVTFTVAGNFYVEPKINLQLVPNKWAEEDAKIAAWIWRTGENGTWTEFFAPKAEENDTLVMAIPQSMDSVIFARFNKTVTEPKWTEEADYIWNSLAGDTIDKLGLTYTITDYWAGTWDVYVPAMFYVTGDSALVKDAAGLEKKDEWNAKAIKAEQDTLVLSLKAGQEYKLKLIEDGNWEGDKVYGYDALTQEDKAGLSADNDNNIVFKLNEDGDVKVVYFWEEDTEIGEWKMTFKLIGDFYVAPVDPTEHTYTVAGNLTDAFGTAWDPENAANDMVKQEDGTYKWEKAELTLAAGTISFKIVEDHSWDVAYPASDYNLNIAEQGEYTLTITFNPETKAVDAVATKTGDAEVTVNYYLVGSVKGWEAKAENIFTLNAEAGEGIEEYVIETTLEVGEGLKVLSSTGTWYPDGTGNEYVVDQNHAGATTIYFRPAYNEEWAAFGGYMYVVPTDPTALDEIMAAGKAVKILRDGQILIIKGNKTFNIQGQLVK